MIDPSSLIISPGHVKFRSKTLLAQGDVMLKPIRATKDMRLANSGRSIAVVSNLGWTVTVPVVATFGDLLPILQMWQAMRYGRACAPQTIRITAINTGSDVLTHDVAGDPLATGAKVRFLWDWTRPTLSSGTLSKTTDYYWRRASATTGTLHPTALDATNNTAAINFTDDGAGALWLSTMFPLEVHLRTGFVRTFVNVAVAELPDLVIAGGQMIWSGNLVFRCYPDRADGGQDGGITDAFFGDVETAYSPAGFDGSETLSTLPAGAAWNSRSLTSEKGWKASFKPVLTPVDNGGWPEAGARLAGFSAAIKGTPLGIGQPEFELWITEGLGAQVPAPSDFVLTFDSHTLTLLQAIAREADERIGVENTVIGEVEWIALGDTTAEDQPPFTIA